jgi:hypothetical protein
MSAAFRRTLTLAIAVLMGARCGFASDAGSTAMNFLKLETGARQSAMAGGGVALADDVNAIRHNPGGMAFFDAPQAAFILTSYQQDIRYRNAAGALPTRYGAFGLQITDLSYGDIPGYDPNNNGVAIQKSGDSAAGLSYAHRIGAMGAVGATLRYLHERLDTVMASGASVDVGGLLRVPSENPLLSKLSLGASLENFGTGVRYVDKSEPLPRQVTLGAGLNQYKHFTAHTELYFSNDVQPYWALGGEYEWFHRFSLRAGYRTGVATGPGFSFGAGANLGRVQLDFAWTPYSQFDDTTQFGVLIRFASDAPSKKSVLSSTASSDDDSLHKISPSETLTTPQRF